MSLEAGLTTSAPGVCWRRLGSLTIAIIPACLAFVGTWIRGIGQLYTRHPHEDAYILFRYAEHLAAGLGIVYNPGGPPTEGATDFLWLVLLAGLVRAGADVAVAAVWLNALGAALLVREITSSARAPYLTYAQAKGLARRAAGCRLMAWFAKRLGARAVQLPHGPRCSK
jgi:hypothetical protein